MKKLMNIVKGALLCVLVACTANAWAKNYTRDFADDSLSMASGYSGGAVSGKTMTTGDGSDLVYVAGGSNDNLNRNTYGWYAGAKIQWPGDEEITAAKAKHVLSFPAQTVYADDFGAGCGLTYGNTYMDTTTWWTWITPEQAYETVKGGGDSITRSLTINGEKTSWVIHTYTVNPSTFTVTFPLTGLTLKDSSGIQWYPAVALIGTKVYGDLNVAIKTFGAVDCVADGAITEAITIDENSTLVLNRGSYTITGLANLTLKGGTFDFNPETAGCVIATGYEVQDNGDNTWTVIRGHEHVWSFVLNGATLTATCGNMENECDVPNRTTSITLTVTGGSDGVAPTFAIDNKDTFLTYVNKDAEIASIGEITVVRTTDDGAETTKWYIGNYTASCIVTVNGEEKTLTQDFSIGGEYAAGGYAVASRSIRYGSFDEALTAAEEGDTIYYRNGDVSSEDEQALTFANVNKDITFDFGGKTFWYRGDADAYVIMSGTGTLTLQNIVLQQPRDKPSWGSYSYNDVVFSGGSFILGNGVTGASTDDKKLALKAVNASVEVQAGLYNCSFWAGEGGSVSLKGGEYWSNFDPASSGYVASGYVTVAATTEGYTYKVVPHEHNFYYVTEGNVITIRCEGAGYEGCAWTLNDNYLTLTAEDAFEGATYAGAKYVITGDSFLYDEEEPVIEYYKDNVKVPTPSAFGSYEARVTVTINGHTATAVKAFNIIHVHQFKYDIAPSATLTATCTNLVSDCDIPDHTTAITLTVTGGSDGVAPTFEIANKAAFLEFVNRDAEVASIGEITTVRNTDDGAETTKWYVGSYTSTCIVTIGGVQYVLTQDFTIDKTAEYTSGWTVGSRDIRYGSWDEALVAAADGDTIYYRDEDRKFETHEFSIGAKNLTIDFTGHTLTKESYVTMTIKNSGSGTLTLQNVVIKQPRGTWSGQIETEGNILFGTGVKVVNTADDSGNYCTITSTSGLLQVTNGYYQCSFDTDGGTVAVSGGKFWEHYDPSQYVNVNDHLVRGISETEGSINYTYEVVPHTHVRYYTAEGAVITCHCKGDDATYCGYNTDEGRQTATLVANDAAESSEPYAGASVTYSTYFPTKSLTITYWNGDTQLAGAPTRFGTYTAKTELEGAVAAASFTITPMAVTITVQNATNATVKVYENETEVTSQTEEYSVTHGNKVTAIYTADEGYTPAVVTNEIESAENGDTIVAPVFKKAGPTIDPPTGGDPETYPEIKPVEGTNGVYVIEVKTNTTTVVKINDLDENDTVIVPPQINAVSGTDTNPIAPDQVKVVADATNATTTVQVDITPAFNITESGNGVEIELNSNAVVTVEIAGKDPETIPVTPVLTGSDDPVKPLVVDESQVAVGVKTIPGLTYNLLSGDAPTSIADVVKTIVAKDTRVVLEAVKGADASKFYKIQVAK